MNMGVFIGSKQENRWQRKQRRASGPVCIQCLKTPPADSTLYGLAAPPGAVSRRWRLCEPCFRKLPAEELEAWRTAETY